MKSASKFHLRRTARDISSGSRFLAPIAMATFVGVCTGFIAVGFIKLVGWCGSMFFGEGAKVLGFMGPYYVIFIPAFAGFLIGPLVTFLAPEAKGHGVPQVLKAIAVSGGRIRPVVVLVKAVASILSLGAGFSVGREGPIVQIGSAFGSTTGQIMKLSEAKIKNLVACGAAAGIAAVFNAPIAGVMFALEVILRDFSAGTMSTVVVAAVSASIISRAFLGDTPAFVVPSYWLQSPWEIIIYLCLAVLSAGAALFFMHSLHASENFWDRVKAPAWLKPVLGGLVVGAMGFYFPQIFSSGFGTVEAALHGNLPFMLLLILVFMKIAATSVSLGAGSSGGVFAPMLFIGAVLGGAVGQLVSRQLAFPIESSGAYALVGMACVFAAGAHAPVTAILIVFEMTNGYHLILPLMAAVVVATTISQFFHRESIYTARLKQTGIDLGFLEEAKLWGRLQVRDAMSGNFEQIPNSLPAKKLLERLSGQEGKTFFTTDPQGKLVGVIEYAELQRLLLEDEVDMILAEDVAVGIREYCLAEDSLIDTARQMAARHLTHAPVVDTGNPNKVIGLLHSEDILRAYSRESLRREDIFQPTGHSQISTKDVVTISFLISTRSALADRLIRDLGLPEGVRFSSIKRGVQVLIPRGDTVLRVRDRIWAALLPEQQDAFRQWLKSQQE